MLASLFFEKEVTCPICLTPFNIVVVKSNKVIPVGRDADFRQIYPDLTPYFYDIYVCPSCHYAAPKSIFDTVKHDEVLAIAEVLSKSKLQIDPLGEREPIDAITCYKLALLCMSYRNVPNSTIAGVCLKTAWVYRVMRDPREIDYLKKAIHYYKEAYANERFPIAGLSENRLSYLLGELSRRAKDYPEAIQWFSKVVMSPSASNEPAILKMAREQWGITKQEYDRDRGTVEEESAATSELASAQ